MAKRKLSKLVGKCKHCDSVVYTYGAYWMHDSGLVKCRALNLETMLFEEFNAQPREESVKIEN